MMGTRVTARAGRDAPERETDDRTHEADDRTIGAHDKPDVAVGGADRLEHADRAEATLRQHGETADRDKSDEQHPKHEGRERDSRGVERIRLRDRGGRLHLCPGLDRAERHT